MSILVFLLALAFFIGIPIACLIGIILLDRRVNRQEEMILELSRASNELNSRTGWL